MTTMVSPVWVQGHWRLRNDDGSLSTATWIANQDTSATVQTDTVFRLRISWGESAGQNTATSSGTITLQYDINASGTWTTVGAATAVKYATSGQSISDATADNNARLTLPTGVASFSEGEFDSNGAGSARTPVDQGYEYEFCLSIDSAQVADNDSITFRLLQGGVAFASVDSVPTLTVDEPLAAITGTLAATDALDAAALSGDVVVKGSFALTDVADTAEISSQVPAVTGTLAATDALDASAVSGTVSGLVTTTTNFYFVAHVTGTVSGPSNALGAPDGVYTTNANTNTSWTSRWRLGTAGTGYIADGTQTITLRMRKGSNTGNPTVSSVTLYQGGASKGALTLASGSTTISSTTGQDLVYTFSGALLNGIEEVDIQVATVGAGGAGDARNAASIDAGTWEATYAVESVTSTGTLSATDALDTAAASGTVTFPEPSGAQQVALLTQSTYQNVALIGGVPGQVLGAINTTEGQDVAAINGTNDIFGSFAPREARDTAVISGGVRVQGSLGATEAEDAASINGGAEIPPQAVERLTSGGYQNVYLLTGSPLGNFLQAVETGVDVASLAGLIENPQTLNAVESPDVAAVEGAGEQDITGGGQFPGLGSFAVTESGLDVASLSGEVSTSGSIAATEGGDFAYLAGPGPISQGYILVTEGQDVAAIQGIVAADGGFLLIEEQGDFASFDGVIPISGRVTASESGDISSVAGAVKIDGALAANEESDIADIAGAVEAVTSTGTLAANEEGDAASLSGTVEWGTNAGSLNASESADISAVVGVVKIDGTLAANEESDTARLYETTPAASYPGPAGRASRSRRRVVIGDRVYAVDERDIPALLEATILDRVPPKTAEVVEGPKPKPRKKKQPQPTVQEVAQTVEVVRKQIGPNQSDLLVALEKVAAQVVQRIEQDEEEAIVLLLAA